VNSDTGEILGLDHVQLAMPSGQEGVTRAFYGDVLGLVEEWKPDNLAARGGVWFRSGPFAFTWVSIPIYAPAGKRTRRSSFAA
jgi:hypothetical protein